MENIVKLKQQRSDLISKARNIITRAENENRNLSAEENVEYDKWFAESAQLKTRIDRLEAHAALESELDRAGPRITSNTSHLPVTGNTGGMGGDRQPVTMDLHGTKITFEVGSPEWIRAQPEYKQAWRNYLLGGSMGAGLMPQATTSRTNDVQGGYLAAPEEFVAELIKDIDNVFLIRNLSRKFSTKAKALGAPRRTQRLDAFQWGTEYTVPTIDGAGGAGLKFGKRVFEPHDMVGEVDVSNEFLRAALIDPEMMVREEIAFNAGELEEKAFMSGTGTGQPLGVFTASADGISTARDVDVGSSSALTADGLRATKYALKEFYRNHPSCRWVFNRTQVGDISKLKASGTGQYLWREGIAEGEPDKLLNIPISESEYAPSTYGSGKYVGILGAWYFAWVIDGLDFGIQRLVELAARSNLTVFLVRRKVDFNVSKEEAFARVKNS